MTTQKDVARAVSPPSDLDLSKFDGPRMHRFLSNFNVNIDTVVNALTYNEVLNLLPKTFAKQHQANICRQYGTVQDNLRKALQEEIDKIVEDEAMRRKLNALDLHVRTEDPNTIFHINSTYFPSNKWKEETISNKKQLRDDMKRLLATLEEENAKREEENENLQKELADARDELKEKMQKQKEIVEIVEKWDDNEDEEPSK